RQGPSMQLGGQGPNCSQGAAVGMWKNLERFIDFDASPRSNKHCLRSGAGLRFGSLGGRGPNRPQGQRLVCGKNLCLIDFADSRPLNKHPHPLSGRRRPSMKLIAVASMFAAMLGSALAAARTDEQSRDAAAPNFVFTGKVKELRASNEPSVKGSDHTVVVTVEEVHPPVPEILGEYK